jgi:hypothetical protein
MFEWIDRPTSSDYNRPAHVHIGGLPLFYERKDRSIDFNQLCTSQKSVVRWGSNEERPKLHGTLLVLVYYKIVQTKFYVAGYHRRLDIFCHAKKKKKTRKGNVCPRRPSSSSSSSPSITFCEGSSVTTSAVAQLSCVSSLVSILVAVERTHQHWLCKERYGIRYRSQQYTRKRNHHQLSVRSTKKYCNNSSLAYVLYCNT